MDNCAEASDTSPELISRIPCPVIPNNNYLSAFDLSMGSQTQSHLSPDRQLSSGLTKEEQLRETPMECQATTEYIDRTCGSRKHAYEIHDNQFGPLSEINVKNADGDAANENKGPKSDLNVSPSAMIQNQTLLPSDISTVSFPAMTPSLQTQLPDWRTELIAESNVLATHSGWYLSADDGFSDGDGPLSTLMAFTIDLASVGSLHSTATTRMHSPNMAANLYTNFKGTGARTIQNSKVETDVHLFPHPNNCRPESKNKRGLARFSETGVLIEETHRLSPSSPQTPLNANKHFHNNLLDTPTQPSQLPKSNSSTPCNDARVDFETSYARQGKFDNLKNSDLFNQIARRHQSISSSCVSDLHLGKGFMDSSWEETFPKPANNISGKCGNFNSPQSFLAGHITQPHTSIVFDTLSRSETVLGKCLLDLRNVDEKSRGSAVSGTESSLSHLGIVFAAHSPANSPQTNQAQKHTPIVTYENSSSCEQSGLPSQSSKFQMRKPFGTPKNTFSVSHSTRPKGYHTPFSKLARDESPMTTMMMSTHRHCNPSLLPDEEADKSPNPQLKSNLPSRTLFQRRSPITMSLGKGLDCD